MNIKCVFPTVVEPFLALGRAGSGGYMLMPLALLQKNNNKKPKGSIQRANPFYRGRK